MNKNNCILKDGKLTLRLSETDTIWILSICSRYSSDDPEDIERVKKDNEIYAQVKNSTLKKFITATSNESLF